MLPKIPEMHKKPGVCYAVTDDGLELPVIDITHPAFHLQVSDAELEALIEGMLRSASIPPAALQAAAQKSILLRGMVASAGTFTTGMNTNLIKLGPDNLGEGYATSFDRQFAASLTPVTFRWRMQDVARLLADGLARALTGRLSQPGGERCPVHLPNIAGGPAADSLNALILLHKEHPAWLAGREVTIHVLDIDPAGPSFGRRAAQALTAEGGPLQGLTLHFQFTLYDWSDTRTLRSTLEEIKRSGGAAAGSSEGGLFEYAADEDIIANLEVLLENTPADFRIVGPVVRDASTLDPRLRATEHVPGRPAVRYMGLAAFAKLAASAGWRIEGTLDGPMHQVVSLAKRA